MFEQVKFTPKRGA